MIKNLLTIGLISASFTGIAQTQVYLEDFENGLPASYTIVDNDGLTPDPSVSEFADAWISLPDPLDSTDTIVGSTSYFDPAGIADRWLITPQITLGAFGNFLYWEGRSHDASYPDGYYILASKTDTQLSSFTDTVFFVGAELSTWEIHSANLSDAGLDGETVHLAFVNRTYDGFKLYIDSISVMVEDPVGVHEISENSISMYPNPANEVIFFNQKVQEVILYNASGQKVASFEDVNRIDISQLPSGMYHVELREITGVLRKKLVKN